MAKEELEKEAKDYVSTTASGTAEEMEMYEHFYLAGAEPREKQIKELKKENKDLRIHQTNAVLNYLEMKVLKDSHRDRANNLQDQLIKAEEILKAVVDFYPTTTATILCEAEQFLNSEIEK